MKTLEEMTLGIDQIFKTKWDVRDGEKVPEPQEIRLGNDAVELEATVLYADLKDSTGLVNEYKKWFAAEIYKAYLQSSCEIIKNNKGVITSFDGDRVMAVFFGSAKNSNAAKAALQINYMVTKVINVKIKEYYPTTPYSVKQAVGIDSCKLFIARTGIRKDNDLVWVGNAANIAAKLCGIRKEGYSSFITEAVFKLLNDSSKYGGKDKQCMWEETSWPEQGVKVYASSWYWSP